MVTQLVSLQVHFGFEHNKLLIHTLAVRAQKVVFTEMLLQGRIVEKVMRLSRIPPVANKAALMLHATMLVQLIIIIEPLATETTQRMALKTRLVGGTRLVITAFHVSLQLLIGKQLMLVSEETFVAGAEVAHALLVGGFYMAMQVRPAKACKITVWVWTVVAQEEDCVADNIFICVFDTDIGVCRREFCFAVCFEFLEVV